MSKKEQVLAAILEVLTPYEGLEWDEGLERVIITEVKKVFASFGLYPRRLKVRMAEDAYLEIDAGDYAKTTEVN